MPRHAHIRAHSDRLQTKVTASEKTDTYGLSLRWYGDKSDLSLTNQRWPLKTNDRRDGGRAKASVLRTGTLEKNHLILY